MPPAPAGPSPARYWLRLLIIVAVAAAYGLHWRQTGESERVETRRQAQLLAAVQSARSLQTALKTHYEVHGRYPETLDEIPTTPPARLPPLAGDWVYQAHNRAETRAYHLWVALEPAGELRYASDGVYPASRPAGELHRLGDWGWYR